MSNRVAVVMIYRTAHQKRDCVVPFVSASQVFFIVLGMPVMLSNLAGVICCDRLFGPKARSTSCAIEISPLQSKATSNRYCHPKYRRYVDGQFAGSCIMLSYFLCAHATLSGTYSRFRGTNPLATRPCSIVITSSWIQSSYYRPRGRSSSCRRMDRHKMYKMLARLINHWE